MNHHSRFASTLKCSSGLHQLKCTHTTALACTGKGSIANGALPFFFSLVFALQLAQKRPRENHGQDDPHENSKDDITRDHKRVTKTPPSPNTRTTPPIIAATIPTFLLSNSSLWSKSSVITTPTQSYSVSTLSIHEYPQK